MGRRGFTGAVLLVALAGCTGVSDETPTVPGGISQSTTYEPVTENPAAPTPALKETRRALVEADTGRFTSTADLGVARIERTGVYRISDASTRATTTIHAPDDVTIVTRSISVDDRIFVQVVDGGAMTLDRCWLTSDVSAVAEWGGTTLGGEATYGIPPEVGAVLDARTAGDTRTIDLFNAAASFGAKMPGALGIDFATTARTPATFTVQDGVVTTRFSLASIVDSAVEAQIDVPVDFRRGVGAAVFTGTISDPGLSVDMSAPREDRQIVLDPAGSDSEFQAAVTACEDR